MARWRPLPALTALLVAYAQPVGAQERTPAGAEPDFVRGHCIAQSHVAEGELGTDLTKRQSRVFCDTAVIVFFAQQPGHVLLEFSERRSNSTAPIGFGGELEKDGINMTVRTLHLPAVAATPVDDGACKYFFKGRRLDGIGCVGVVDRDGRRTVADIAFNADPGQ